MAQAGGNVIAVQGSTGQKGAPSQAPAMGPVLVWIGVLIAITLLAGLGILWYRRRVLSTENAAGEGSLMEEFRRMRDSGEMTVEEYESARKVIVSKLSEKARAAKGTLPVKEGFGGRPGPKGS